MHNTSLKKTGCEWRPSSIQDTTRFERTQSGRVVDNESQRAAADAPFSSSFGTGSVVSARRLSKFSRSTEVGDRASSMVDQFVDG